MLHIPVTPYIMCGWLTLFLKEEGLWLFSLVGQLCDGRDESHGVLFQHPMEGREMDPHTLLLLLGEM